MLFRSISQVEITSCGLNGGALPARGEYPAAIACVLTNGHMPHVTNGKLEKKLPCITYRNDRAVIADITDGTVIGYRWFHFQGGEKLSLELTGDFHGTVQVSTALLSKPMAELPAVSGEAAPLCLSGECPMYLTFRGTGNAMLHKIRFLPSAGDPNR